MRPDELARAGKPYTQRRCAPPLPIWPLCFDDFERRGSRVAQSDWETQTPGMNMPGKVRRWSAKRRPRLSLFFATRSPAFRYLQSREWPTRRCKTTCIQAPTPRSRRCERPAPPAALGDRQTRVCLRAVNLQAVPNLVSTAIPIDFRKSFGRTPPALTMTASFSRSWTCSF